jgi:hypothetical protein
MTRYFSFDDLNGAYSYFAVPDPLDPAKMSYWYLPKKGWMKDKLQPWPPRRNKWGALWIKDVPEQVRNDKKAYTEYITAHFNRVRLARIDVERIVSADPQLAAVRFSHLAIRCCRCGKALTEQRSKTYGIGPECRQGASPDYLSDLLELVKTVYAAELLT